MLGNQHASYEGYDRLCRDGYRDVVIPVWQARPAWDSGRDPADNGRLAARDPVLRTYADQASMVAIGRLVQGPCPRAGRHLYLAELVHAFPDTQFWALGQFVRDVNRCSRHDFVLRLSLTDDSLCAINRFVSCRCSPPCWRQNWMVTAGPISAALVGDVLTTNSASSAASAPQTSNGSPPKKRTPVAGHEHLNGTTRIQERLSTSNEVR